jgi:hypothetical protein
LASGLVTTSRSGAKVFWFFFSKKNFLFLLVFLIFERLGSCQKRNKETLFRGGAWAGATVRLPAGGVAGFTRTNPQGKSFLRRFFSKKRPLSCKRHFL